MRHITYSRSIWMDWGKKSSSSTSSTRLVFDSTFASTASYHGPDAVLANSSRELYCHHDSHSRDGLLDREYLACFGILHYMVDLRCWRLFLDSPLKKRVTREKGSESATWFAEVHRVKKRLDGKRQGTFVSESNGIKSHLKEVGVWPSSCNVMTKKDKSIPTAVTLSEGWIRSSWLARCSLRRNPSLWKGMMEVWHCHY